MAQESVPDFSGQTIYQHLIKTLLVARSSSSLYLGEDSRSGETVFLEILHVTTTEDKDLSGRFRRRMETVSQLNHPNIAPISLIGQSEDKRPYAVIEYAAGSFLDQYLSDKPDAEKDLSPADALTLISQLAQALAIAHPAGIFHHDLRPQHIYMRMDGTPLFVDLGAIIDPLPHNESLLQQTGELDYASPEQLRGQALTGRSNIFSLGVILYELLAGSKPQLPVSNWDIFERRSLPKEIPLEEARPGLTPTTYQLTKNCLWQQDWNRFDTVRDMQPMIEEAIQAERSALITSSTRATRRPRLVMLIVTLVVLVVVAAVIALLIIR